MICSRIHLFLIIDYIQRIIIVNPTSVEEKDFCTEQIVKIVNNEYSYQ